MLAAYWWESGALILKEHEKYLRYSVVIRNAMWCFKIQWKEY